MQMRLYLEERPLFASKIMVACQLACMMCTDEYEQSVQLYEPVLASLRAAIYAEHRDRSRTGLLCQCTTFLDVCRLLQRVLARAQPWSQQLRSVQCLAYMAAAVHTLVRAQGRQASPMEQRILDQASSLGMQPQWPKDAPPQPPAPPSNSDTMVLDSALEMQDLAALYSEASVLGEDMQLPNLEFELPELGDLPPELVDELMNPMSPTDLLSAPEP